MSKIGVFGGTFDPVHYGHVWLARQAASELLLDKVLVTPTKKQPFKMDRTVTSGVHRYNMLKLAFAGDGIISVSDIELKKDGISYTIDTLREIRRIFGVDAEIYFILGADAFLKIEKWKDADELLSGYSFIIGIRPGHEDCGLCGHIRRLKSVYNTKATVIGNKQIDVSSTEIKEMIKTGGRLSVIPEDVERYIKTNGLYQGIY